MFTLDKIQSEISKLLKRTADCTSEEWKNEIWPALEILIKRRDYHIRK